MARMNDSKRWLMVAQAFKNDTFPEVGICACLRRFRSDCLIEYTDETRMLKQMWRAAKNGKLKSARKGVARAVFGYLWPQHQREPRIAAALKLSRLVQR